MLADHQSTLGTVTLGTVTLGTVTLGNVALHRITESETCQYIADSLERGTLSVVWHGTPSRDSLQLLAVILDTECRGSL